MYLILCAWFQLLHFQLKNAEQTPFLLLIQTPSLFYSLPPPQRGRRKSRTNNEYEINATPESRCSCTRSVPVRLQIETSTSQCCDRQARGSAPLDRGGWGIKGGSGYCRRCPGRRLLTWTCIALSHRLIDRRLTGWRETDSSETGRKRGDEGGREASGDATDWPGRKCSSPNGGNGGLDAAFFVLFKVCPFFLLSDWSKGIPSIRKNCYATVQSTYYLVITCNSYKIIDHQNVHPSIKLCNIFSKIPLNNATK